MKTFNVSYFRTHLLVLFFYSLAWFPNSSKAALSEKETKMKSEWTAELEKRQGPFQKDCGKSLPITMDDSVVKHFVAKDRLLTEFFCEEALGAVRDLCEQKEFKPIVLGKVKSIRCAYVKESGKIGIKLNGTQLIVGFNVDSRDIQSKTRSWLQKNLQVSGGMTVEQKTEMNIWQKSLTGREEGLKNDCGVAVKATLDPSVAAGFIEAGKNPMNACMDAINGIRMVCNDEKAKAKFASKVKKLKCAYNKDPKGFTAKISNQELTITFGVKTYGLDSKIQDWLPSHL